MRQVRSLIYIGLILLGTMSSALANEQAAISGTGLVRPGDYLAQIMVSLLLVLLIIFFGAWLLRRFGRFASVADGKLMVLGAVSVGQRERIMLIQVGDDQLLIGVTSSKISTLHKLDQPVDLVSEEQSPTVPTNQKVSFTKRLQDAIMQRKSSDQS